MIFISHSSEDKAQYENVTDALEARKLQYWAPSQVRPGGLLSDQLRSAIEESDLCVFVATPQSVNSNWCTAELGAFWGAGKKVIIYVADSSLDASSLPRQFHGHVYEQRISRVVDAAATILADVERGEKRGNRSPTIDDSIVGNWHFEWLVTEPKDYAKPLVTETLSFTDLNGEILKGRATGSPVGDYDLIGRVAPLNLSFVFRPIEGIYSDWTGVALLEREASAAREMHGWYLQYRENRPRIFGTVNAIKHPVPPAQR